METSLDKVMNAINTPKCNHVPACLTLWTFKVIHSYQCVHFEFLVQYSIIKIEICTMQSLEF